MKLLVVESPTKARKIQGFLESGYKVLASLGHIREIPPDGMNIDIQNGFEPTFQVIKGKGEIVKEIKDEAKKAEVVYLASDPDREGEAIASHIRDILDASSRKKCKRVSYTEITKKAITDAIKNARDIDMNLVSAQKARQVLDRLIGYRASPLLWRTVGKGTSAGRVQSIALKLICERQKEIDEFKPVKYWLVDALLHCTNGDFWARVVVPKQKDNRFLAESDAKKAYDGIKKSTFLLSDIESQEKTIKPNPPFDTTSLTSACSSIFKWGASKTMQVAQNLYQGGRISYIRSDSYSISQEALDAVRKFIGDMAGQRYIPAEPCTYAKKSSAAAQEAHECIRPTHVDDSGDDIEDDDEKKMYNLVRDRFIACQMKPMVVNSVKYTVKASCGETLVARGQSIVFDGFTKVWRHTKTSNEMLPKAEKGEKLDLKDSKCVANETKPPDRFSDGSLVEKMEADGVGRPATRASILKSLVEKGYVKKDKSAFVPLPIGMRIVEFLAPNFVDFFMDIKFTARLEEELDEIAHGKLKFLDVVTKVYDKLKEEIGKAEKNKVEKGTGQKCTACKEGEIVEKFGKTGQFFACNKYPDCKSVYVKGEDGKFIERPKKDPPKKAPGKCPKCGSDLFFRKSMYGAFVGCGGYPKCKYIQKDKGKEIKSDKEEAS